MPSISTSNNNKCLSLDRRNNQSSTFLANVNRMTSSAHHGASRGDAMPGDRILKPREYVGFDKIAHQYKKKSIREGFSFNIMCIGETGIGKSTLMETLFNRPFGTKPSDHLSERVTLDTNTFELREENVRLKLTLIETRGYGDQLTKANSHAQILTYLDEQYEKYLEHELTLRRQMRQCDDTRVHLCLYFICPTGHSLKAIDLSTMKALNGKCNVIPIIAKSDTISKSQMAEFKRRIMNELAANNVQVYQFPVNDSDLQVSNLNASANASFPLAVIGSSEMVEINKKLVRGRAYQWGNLSVDNEAHCDLSKLRDMLLFVNTIDLIELTHAKSYQAYRSRRLIEMGFADVQSVADNDDQDAERIDENAISGSTQSSSSSSSSSSSIEDVLAAKRKHIGEYVEHAEKEIKDEFVRKVKSKETEIRAIEDELNARYTAWKSEVAARTERLEAAKRQLDAQRVDFNARKFTLDKTKSATLNTTHNGCGGGKHKKK